MTDERRPHPRNVTGPFYVQYGCCTSCDVPMQAAPGHFAYDTDDHCFVCRQPQTAAETSDMIGTAWMAEFQCIRYRGDDPDVLRGSQNSICARFAIRRRLRTSISVIRNHVLINVVGPPAISTPQDLAQEFVEHLTSQNNEWRQFKVTPIQNPKSCASIQLSWYEDHFHSVAFAKGPDSPDDWHIEHVLQNDLNDAA